MDGICTKLMVAGAEQTAQCRPTAWYRQYPTGVVAFNALSPPLVVSFSGTADAQLRPDFYRLEVRRILIQKSARDIEEVSVFGSCTAIGRFRPDGHLDCEAVDSQGHDYFFTFAVNQPLKRWQPLQRQFISDVRK